MGKPKRRGNGQGTAYKRGNTWEAQIVVDWHGNTPVKRRKGGFKTKKDAIDYCSTMRNQVDPPKKPKTLAQYYEQYQQNDMMLLSKSKQTCYRVAWKKLSSIHHRTIGNITVQDLRDAVAAECKTHYTAKDARDLLTNLYKLAAIDGMANKDLPSFIILPNDEGKDRKAFTQEEQAALWKLYESGDMDAAIPLLMIYTGAMPGEVRSMKVENINLEAHTITGVGLKTKTRKDNPIVLSDTIIPVIESLIDHARPNGYLWKRLKQDWYDHYYAALAKAGCRRLEPYSCRHTTATALAVTENIAPVTVQKIMRWSSLGMLSNYAHPDINDLVTAVNTMKKK